MGNIVKNSVLILSMALLVLAPVGMSQGVETSTSGCVVLTNNLFWGSRDYFTGGGVTKLQVFLSSQGYLKHEPTGYFGVLTWNAVRKFQREHNIIQTGFVGPLTRAEIERVSCGVVISSVRISSMTPKSGPVGTTVTLYGSGFTADNTVMFGNGAIVHVPSSDSGTRITFNVPEYLNPPCYYANPPCMLSFAPSQQVTSGNYSVYVQNSIGTSNTLTFKVTKPTTDLHIDSIVPKKGPVGTNVSISGTGFSSSNTIKFGQGAMYNVPSVNGGTLINFTIPEYMGHYCPVGMACIAIAHQIVPGDYQVSVDDGHGLSNEKTFTVTSDSTSGSQVRITGIDAPNTLRVGQTGTWTVRVDASASQQLSYSVRWGDEPLYAAQTSSSASTQQTTTFTHVYTYPGTFTPTFTVTSSSGTSATMSASVVVTNF